MQGIISISSKGTGYVATGEVKNKGQDPEIDFQHLNTALHGDMVEIILHPKGKNRQTAEVSKIISRAKMNFAGVLEEENKMFFLKPDDTKMYTDILIPTKFLNNAKVGQKVFVEIISWKDPHKAPEGKVIKVLGRPGDNDTEMESIAIEKGFDAKLPHKVEEEARKIKQNGIKETDYAGRRDFRKTLTFTIDPSDAKDFDDAISFRFLPSLNKEGAGGGNSKDHPASGTPPKKGGEEQYEVGIHIADVSHYVKIGSALDEEARERGTSVYLVDRTIPMLPETLSNDLCSLVPNKDRLTMSAVFIIDKNAHVKSKWFGRTVIHSKKRFTYEEAEELIKKSAAPFHKELFILNSLAKKLTGERFAQGAISLDQEEVKFVLDKNGVPLKVIKKERGDSNRLIEEFMLLANKKVAEVLSPKNIKGVKDEGVSIYRVHDLPSKEKMADLAFFLRSLGHRVSLQNGLIPTYEINKLLESLAGKNEEDTVHRAVIRSMAKALYSTKNIGHYGLAFQYYTHFTSPIRRYPDIMVHRLLEKFLSGKKIKKEDLKEKLIEYEKIALNASEQEKRAADAERASIKYKQVEYMSRYLGKSFDGVISGITEWGMYVEELETKCEGLVRVRDMNDDFYIFNEKKLELTGQKKKKKYRLGGRVKIKVKSVDLERKTIDYILT
ncbi:MAG: Ribonuclease R [Candidatus Nomurabacteria bacterium GW2011_GWC2_41_8]|uniref:Ribonuclease R n=2 Tax=Candidatus Nomuraibacteriota TaxID=1752729 RepID=A0A0G0ZRJ1_9BACT|nr:MAG: Ribonuclease R [Candidatus Nomurabacteria bacterium GW2011_GWA2_41_25]KKS24591.1 MAG: Ribonuclease R [Candidatus Nomurabacteria bacterium GW2011_GWC2_41_8]